MPELIEKDILAHRALLSETWSQIEAALDYQTALNYIHSFDDPYKAALRDHGKQTWGLSRISELLAKLEDPQLAYPVIHVAGTKGKGSTCALIAQGLIEANFKTGLFVSPHLEDWRERIQINARPIGRREFGRLVSYFESKVKFPAGLSEFEITTALAFLHFKLEHCDVAVIEVGLGGRLDATNVVQPFVSVVTNISFDHMQLLGNTLTEIAGEKAAIIKENVPVVSAPQVDEALRVIEERAHNMNSQLVLVGRDVMFEARNVSINGSTISIGTADDQVLVDLRLPGLFQHENAAVAYSALMVASQHGMPISRDEIVRGLGAAEWPGRMELISESPIAIIDSAHTPYSIGELIRSLKQTVNAPNWTFVFGCMADKDIRGMLIHILPQVDHLILTQAENERAASPHRLLEIAINTIAELNITSKHIQLTTVKNINDAVSTALSSKVDNNLTCYTGSLSIAGAARSLLRSKLSHEIIELIAHNG